MLDDSMERWSTELAAKEQKECLVRGRRFRTEDAAPRDEVQAQIVSRSQCFWGCSPCPELGISFLAIARKFCLCSKFGPN